MPGWACYKKAHSLTKPMSLWHHGTQNTSAEQAGMGWGCGGSSDNNDEENTRNGSSCLPVSTLWQSPYRCYRNMIVFHDPRRQVLN